MYKSIVFSHIGEFRHYYYINVSTGPYTRGGGGRGFKPLTTNIF